ncbi:hypothetical protein D6779_00240 [Candidatus Parcubacteria bacterium]|nr:MAG: hypothetical protein D6779_00240 [Candidatus Parcubacteria bacterium]
MQPDLADLKRVIQQYEAKRVSLDELKATILATAERVTEYHRRTLRKLLLEVEGRLDMIQFTTDSHRVYDTTLPVLDVLKEALEESEKDSA